MTLHLSEHVEMYLETIYRLTERGGRARTTDIAAGWSVAPSSATEMIRRLAKQGYLHYKPYRGVELTEKGLEVGRDITRKHRLLEVFLTSEVGMDGMDRVSQYACALEHAMPPELEAWICSRLGHPGKSPTGESIPPGKCCPRSDSA